MKKRNYRTNSNTNLFKFLTLMTLTFTFTFSSTLAILAEENTVSSETQNTSNNVVDNYTISFTSSIGVIPESYLVTAGTVLDNLPALVDTTGLKTFLGWYLDSTYTIEALNKVVSEDITLYAKWGLSTSTRASTDGTFQNPSTVYLTTSGFPTGVGSYFLQGGIIVKYGGVYKMVGVDNETSSSSYTTIYVGNMSADFQTVTYEKSVVLPKVTNSSPLGFNSRHFYDGSRYVYLVGNVNGSEQMFKYDLSTNTYTYKTLSKTLFNSGTTSYNYYIDSLGTFSGKHPLLSSFTYDYNANTYVEYDFSSIGYLQQCITVGNYSYALLSNGSQYSFIKITNSTKAYTTLINNVSAYEIHLFGDEIFLSGNPLMTYNISTGKYRYINIGLSSVGGKITTSFYDNTLYSVAYGALYKAPFTAYTNSTYLVSFNANGGDSTPTPAYYEYNKTYSVLPVIYKSGYDLDGWYKEVALTNKVTEASTMSTASNHTLYAKWNPTVYSNYFNANGGSGSQYQNATYLQPLGTLPVPTRTGYTFTGWFTSTSGGTQVTSSTIQSNTYSTSYYAQWTPATYTLTFDHQGGTSGTTSKSITYLSTYGTLPTPTRTGYSFKGWFTASSGGTQRYDTTSVTTTTDITLYAQWTALSYTVSFDSQGGSTVSSRTVYFGSTYGSLSTPTKTGYTFVGWFDSIVGGTQFTSATLVNTASNHTLYGRWTPKTYTITYNTNGGNAITADTKTLGTTYTLPIPIKTGYKFDGWYSDVALTTSVGNDYTVTASNVTLYAKWSLNNFTLSGRILDQWSKPVSDVEVSYNSITVTSDEDGRYVIISERQDTPSLLSFSKVNYKPVTLLITLESDMDISEETIMSKLFYTVTGYAKDTFGNFIRNTIVKVNGVQGATDTEGIYQINIPISLP